MALATLRRLLSSLSRTDDTLDADRRLRIVGTAARFLEDADAEVRKEGVELASDAFGFFGEADKATFWRELERGGGMTMKESGGGGGNGRRLGVVMYYVAKKSGRQ